MSKRPAIGQALCETGSLPTSCFRRQKPVRFDYGNLILDEFFDRCVGSGDRFGDLHRECDPMEPVAEVKPGTIVTRADAERDLQRRIGQTQGKIIATVGNDRWGGLSAPARAAVTSVAYNYGSLPDSVVNAIRTGGSAEIATAIRGLAGHNDGVNRMQMVHVPFCRTLEPLEPLDHIGGRCVTGRARKEISRSPFRLLNLDFRFQTVLQRIHVGSGQVIRLLLHEFFCCQRITLCNSESSLLHRVGDEILLLDLSFFRRPSEFVTKRMKLGLPMRRRCRLRQ